MRGRLFESLQEGIEGCSGEHVDLVDVVDLIGTTGGGVGHGFAKITDLLHAIIGSSVDLQDIESAALCDFYAGRIFRVKVRAGPPGTVQSLREDAGRSRLSRAAGANEKVGLGDAVLGDGVAQGLDDMILPQDVIKSAGAVFPGKDLVAHARTVARGGEMSGKECSGQQTPLWELGRNRVPSSS